MLYNSTQQKSFINQFQILQRILKMSAITITFGQRAQNHRGMQVIGQLAQKGYTIPQLCLAKEAFQQKGYKCQLVDLNKFLDQKSEEAAVLVVRKGANCFFRQTIYNSQELFKELRHLKWDTKAKMYGRVVNKKARYNLCFGDEYQEANYEQGKGTIVQWKNVPMLKLVRNKLKEFIPKSQNMFAEGNFYYDSSKCGVCFHGDEQRKKVIGIRLSTTQKSWPLHYQWFKHKEPIGQRAIIELNNGDLYIMSQKAVGNDQKKRNIPTLKHASGCPAFTTIK